MTASLVLVLSISRIHSLTLRTAQADETAFLTVLQSGSSLNDVRQKNLKTLNGHFPFKVPATVADWENRAQELRMRILVSNGLWPMPEKTPLNAVIHSKVERDGFSVEKVYFESYPGFFVTGMLFRPLGRTGPFPAVLSPHGHGGRLQQANSEKILKQIENGEERFEKSGSFPKLALCAQMARMGCVTFMPDMIGYGDSIQIRSAQAHGAIPKSPELDTPDKWSFHSTQAELRLQSIMGLQTWSCIRSLDFLESLPDVDAKRIGVTGGSGGGTQTILLGAIDPRPMVAYPQGMVSTAMQGGCVCENVSLLRIGTGNVELAALFAPRPLAMATANDWTKEMMTDGYPQLQQLYTMLRVGDQVDCTPMPQFPHNFNYVTRAKMYSWFNKHLDLGLQEPIIEEDYVLLADKASDPAYHVWDQKHPTPQAKGLEFETTLLKYLDDQANRQIQAIWPTDAASWARYQYVVGGAVKTIIGRTIDQVGPITRTKVNKVDQGDHWLFKDLITITDHQEQLPVISLYPQQKTWNGRVVIWLTGKGKAGIFAGNAKPVPAVQQLLDQGCAVVSADLFAQGEFVSDSLSADQNRTVNKNTHSPAFTYCYNNSLFAQRTHDILSLVQWIRTGNHKVSWIALVGTDGIAAVVATSGAVCDDAVQCVAVQSNGFRFTQIPSYRDVNFLSGIVKYGDFPALLALNAPNPLLVIGDDATTAVIASQTYAANGSQIHWKAASSLPAESISTWLLKQK